MAQTSPEAKNKKHTSSLIIIVAIIAMAIGIATSIFKHSNAAITDNANLQVTLLQTPRQIEQFQLIDNKNMPFTNENLANHWTIMFFGYTNCPDICPIIMAELKKMDINLKESKVTDLPQVIMVSVDPERDTPEILNQYVKLFDDSFIGATADPAQIEQLSKELGIAYMKVDPAHDHNHDDMDYHIDHSGTIVLFNPDGNVVGYFTMPIDGDTLAHDFQVITS